MTPANHREASSGPHSDYWYAAELRHVLQLVMKGTLGEELAELPPGKHAIPMAVVYRNKYAGDECIAPRDLPPENWKARAVVKGYTMGVTTSTRLHRHQPRHPFA